jgi:aryl-alcohol dehydrogenase-like predicted oxidoreductase
MKVRYLGRSGIQVSELGLGTMMFGAFGNTEVSECISIVHRALDAGINFVDTADMYSRGESERIVGLALADRREEVILATKFYNPMGSTNDRGSSRRWVIRACDASLRRLGTDYIDVYYAHRPDPHTDMDETLSALSDLVHQGKVRMIGTSTFPAEQIVEGQWVAEHRSLVPPRCEQPPYSILVRGAEANVFPVCQRFGIGIATWSPLNAGWLTGKYQMREGTPDGSRFSQWGSRNPMWSASNRSADEKRLIVQGLTDLVEKAGIDLIQLSIGFTLNHPAVSSTIVGPRICAQLDKYLQAAERPLSADVFDEIDAIVPPGHTVDQGDLGYTPPALEQPRLRRRS